MQRRIAQLLLLFCILILNASVADKGLTLPGKRLTRLHKGTRKGKGKETGARIGSLVRTLAGTQEPVPRQGGKCLGGKAFLCITGQVSRLEVANKLRQVLIPLAEYYGGTKNIHVALVLDPTGNYATNAQGKISDKVVNQFTSGADALKILHQANFSQAVYVKLNPEKHPTIGVEYLSKLKMESYYRMLRLGLITPEKHKEQAENHARKFDSFRQCFLHLNKSHDWPYHGKCDVAMRLRDDTVLHAPMDIPYLSSLVNRTRGIVASSCGQYHGLNDHAAIMHPSVAEKYFTLPFSEKLNNITGITFTNRTSKFQVVSSEIYLNQIYTKFSLPITVSDYMGPMLRHKYLEDPKGCTRSVSMCEVPAVVAMNNSCIPNPTTYKFTDDDKLLPHRTSYEKLLQLKKDKIKLALRQRQHWRQNTTYTT